MKIGIITHHYVKNYGAFLQMKGMYEVLKCVYPEADVKVVNFVVTKHWVKNVIHILHYRRGVDTFCTYWSKVKQLVVLTRYERSIPRTRKRRNADEINKLGLDLIVLGSDEIWNFHGSGHHALKFGTGLYAPKMIAYAPSAGAVTGKSDVPENIKVGMLSIDNISGRDSETIELVKRITERNALKMLDPTFLYNFDIDIEKERIQPKPYKYILVYDCKLRSCQVADLMAYAADNNLKILGAGDYKTFYDEVTINLTPYEWVSLFRNAEMVVTGTFHGTVFSIKYEKDFVCYPTEKNRINKISSLLKDMGQIDRLIKIGEESELIRVLDTPVSYDYTEYYIQRKKEEALRFLREK